jgi:hypothetical protein
MSRIPFLLVAALFIGGSAIACSTADPAPSEAPRTDDAGPEPLPPPAPAPAPDAAPPPDPPFVFSPAPDGTFARAVSGGGSVIAAPTVVPIIYASDPQKDVITAFTAKFATSAYWGQVTGEYGVGPLTARTPIIVSDEAPASFSASQVVLWLASMFMNDPDHFGTPDPNTLYAIYYPSETTLTLGVEKSCTDFGGYHSEFRIGETRFGFAVMARCATFNGLSGSDTTTMTASHEMVEWATDPFPATSAAFKSVDDDHAVWGRFFGGELADLCNQAADLTVVPADLGFRVQRSWSNASAAAGHHPCVPIAKEPYFTAFPTKPETITVTNSLSKPMTTRGFQVGVGESKTIDLTMYSDADAGTWTVQVVDLARIHGLGSEFSYRLNRPSGRSGDTLKLTITGLVPATSTSGQGFLLVSKTKTDETFFPVWVTN